MAAFLPIFRVEWKHRQNCSRHLHRDFSPDTPGGLGGEFIFVDFKYELQPNPQRCPNPEMRQLWMGGDAGDDAMQPRPPSPQPSPSIQAIFSEQFRSLTPRIRERRDVGRIPRAKTLELAIGHSGLQGNRGTLTPWKDVCVQVDVVLKGHTAGPVRKSAKCRVPL